MQKSLNNITPEEIVIAEELSALYFTPKEISSMIQIDYEGVKDQMEEEDGIFYEAFQRGRLQSEVDLRKSILMLAKAGSSPAQTMALDLLNKSKAKMRD